MTERQFATEVVRRLREAGHEAVWAGGCVRDSLLGLEPADYDVATSATPDRVRPLFRRTLEMGASFGVIEVLGPDSDTGEPLKVQIATFRSDGDYTDGRRPDGVAWATAEEDALRRDFTINGMFFDPLGDLLIDHVGGREDLNAKVLRAIGDPHARFTEDKLRMLRAVRFAARFDLAIDPATRDAISQRASEITAVSAERIAEELRRILTHPSRYRGFSHLLELKLFFAILGEIPDDPKAVESIDALMGYLHEPIWPSERGVTFPLAFAALVHPVGARVAERMTRRLKLSRDEGDRIVWLIQNMGVPRDALTMKFSKLQPLLIHPGVGELLALHRTIQTATKRDFAAVEYCETVLRDTPADELDPVPLIDGEVLTGLGMTPGPKFKTLLQAARDAQLDRVITTRDGAIALVRAMA